MDRSIIYSAILAVTAIISGCSGKGGTAPDEPAAEIGSPAIQTTEATFITSERATSGGNVISDGGGAILERGVVWDKEPNPTIDLPSKTSDGTGTGEFVSEMTGLEELTTYYYRAFAINTDHISYGEEKSFTTGRNATLRVMIDDVPLELIYVEGGTFNMGATPEQEPYAQSYEKPVHKVTLDSYYIGKYEVTQKQYIALIGSNPSIYTGNDLPVDNMLYSHCESFVTALGEKTGLSFAVPTEAQWEYAARGGNQSKGYVYSGSDNLDEVGVYSGNKGDVGGSHPVGTKKPNELGIYDMSGNIYEWCSDWEGNYTAEDQVNPTGPEDGRYSKVMRGGSWFDDSNFCRNTKRLYHYITEPRLNNGLRVVLNIDDKTAKALHIQK